MIRPKCIGGDSVRIFCAGALLVGAFAGAGAQTATGDGRGTVSEPTFPAVCLKVTADLTISGGEPSSELNTATDTSALQTALSSSGCAGKAVEVVMGSGGQNAMVIAPIAIPKTVTLLVDGGVTLFGSRNAADYQISASSSTCGSTDGGSACNPLISLGQSTVNGTGQYTGTTVTGLMGYGVINGRGYDKLITISGSTVTVLSNSWWDNAVGGAEDSPVLVYSYKTASAVLYKITLLNSPHFHVKITGQANAASPTNFTVWGIKLLTPYSPHNTDGIDPTGVVNMTVANSVIGDGDDESAISGSSLTQNFTYNNLLLASGHGLSIGSITTNAITNVLYNNVNFSGQAADGNEIALRIKTSCGSGSGSGGGGLVSQITYQNACIQNVKAAIELDPYYASSSGSSCALFGTAGAPITYQNVYVLNPTSSTGYINLQGYNNSSNTNNYSNVVLNNVYANASSLTLREIQSTDQSVPTPYDVNITLNGSYYPAGWGSLASTPNGVTETVNGTAASSFPSTACANAFPTLLGEVFASTTTGGVTTNNINSAATVTIPATVTLNAMVLPTNSEATYSPYTGVAAPTAGVNFYDGATLVGTGSLSANGTLASVTIANPSAGVHTYTAQYAAGDTNYPGPITLGANTTGTEAQQVQITVNAGPAAKLGFTASPASPIVYGNGSGTVTVAVQDAAGDTISGSSASVTLTVTGPSSYSHVYTASAVNGVATFSSIANPPGVGSFTYTASSGVLTNATASESVTAATLTVTGNPASRVFGNPNPAFTATIAWYVNGDGSGVVSGAPVFSTTAVRTSPVVAGGYPITVGVGTLSAANYNFSTSSGTLTITGGAPQVLNFLPLPAFTHGGSYQLSASASSGLAVTYSVSGGGASVSGATLTVPSGAAGQTITVTAAQAGNSNYAAATSVAQSFVAQ